MTFPSKRIGVLLKQVAIFSQGAHEKRLARLKAEDSHEVSFRHARVSPHVDAADQRADVLGDG